MSYFNNEKGFSENKQFETPGAPTPLTPPTPPTPSTTPTPPFGPTPSFQGVKNTEGVSNKQSRSESRLGNKTFSPNFTEREKSGNGQDGNSSFFSAPLGVRLPVPVPVPVPQRERGLWPSIAGFPRERGPEEKKVKEVVSITYEEIGLFPRSFSRVLDRFLKQVFSDVENLVIQEYRFYRYLFLTTLKCLLILFFVPFFVNFLAKTYVVRPLTEYFWNTKQSEIFLNSYQQKRAFSELKEFEEKTYFESLIFPKSAFTPNMVTLAHKHALVPSLPFQKEQAEEVSHSPFENPLPPKGGIGMQAKIENSSEHSIFAFGKDKGKDESPSMAGAGHRGPTIEGHRGPAIESQRTAIENENTEAQALSSLAFGFVSPLPLEGKQGSSEDFGNVQSNGQKQRQGQAKLAMENIENDAKAASFVDQENEVLLRASHNLPYLPSGGTGGTEAKGGFAPRSLGTLSISSIPPIPSMVEGSQEGNKVKTDLLINSYTMKSSLFVYQTQEASKNMQQRYQEKTIELAQRYNDQSIEAITNFFADLISLFTLLYLLYALEIQINITKSFLLEVFFGLDDSKKSLLILLITDLLVGYHSSNLWELFFEFLFHHYGLPDSQTGIFLLVATLPVLLDVLFKYLIFRHLNRSSPATVATYHAMIE